MNSLRRRIDRFCVLHPNFGIPNLMLYIVIGNIAFYLLSLFSTLDGGSFYSILSFSWAGLKQGQLWRLLSFSFLPTDTRPFWLLVSCYFYYWIGSTLEREWGTAKFTIYYLSGVLLTALGAVITSLITGYDWQVAGATYVNLAMFFAFASIPTRRYCCSSSFRSRSSGWPFWTRATSRTSSSSAPSPAIGSAWCCRSWRC